VPDRSASRHRLQYCRRQSSTGDPITRAAPCRDGPGRGWFLQGQATGRELAVSSGVVTPPRRVDAETIRLSRRLYQVKSSLFVVQPSSPSNKRKHNIMAKTSVICIAKTESQAIRIVEALKSAAFSSNDISVLLPDKAGSKDFAHEQNTKAPEGAATGGISGGVLGGALGWLAGIGALAIPGVGPFIAAGPIMAALGGAAVGGAVGGITGALIGMGIPEYEAKRYEGKVKNGNILISVHTESSDQVKRAKEIFTQAGAEDISSTGEASTPKSSSKDTAAVTTSGRNYDDDDDVAGARTGADPETYIFDYKVVDRDGDKVGTVNDLWPSETSSGYSFIGVHTGWFMGKNHVVPADGMTIDHDERIVRLPLTAAAIKSAPDFNVSGDIDENDQLRIRSHYGVTKPTSSATSRSTPASTGLTGANTAPTTGVTTGMNTGTGKAAVTSTSDTVDIPLREERVKVGTREVQAGSIRLRRIVRTETVNVPVELRSEDVVIERVAGERGSGGTEDISEKEIVIPVSRQEPVVQKTTEVSGVVRARKTASKETQQVQETVRKEDVQVDRDSVRGKDVTGKGISNPDILPGKGKNK